MVVVAASTTINMSWAGCACGGIHLHNLDDLPCDHQEGARVEECSAEIRVVVEWQRHILHALKGRHAVVATDVQTPRRILGSDVSGTARTGARIHAYLAERRPEPPVAVPHAFR